MGEISQADEQQIQRNREIPPRSCPSRLTASAEQQQQQQKIDWMVLSEKQIIFAVKKATSPWYWKEEAAGTIPKEEISEGMGNRKILLIQHMPTYTLPFFTSKRWKIVTNTKISYWHPGHCGSLLRLLVSGSGFMHFLSQWMINDRCTHFTLIRADVGWQMYQRIWFQKQRSLENLLVRI